MDTKTGLIPLILIISISFSLAFGDDDSGGIIVSTDKEIYETGETLFITGHVEEKKMPILALRIFDPEGSILSANNVEIEEENEFSKIVFLDSPFYEKAGIYTIKIDYGKLDKEIYFEIKSDVPFEEPVIVEEEEIILELTGLETDKPEYTDNDTITISGTVNSVSDETVLIGIYDPFGIPTGFYFGDIDSNKKFSASFLAKAGINFKIDGSYLVIAHYGESIKEISFDFESVPVEDIEQVDEPEQEKPTKQDDPIEPEIIKENKQTPPKITEEKTKPSTPVVVKEKFQETKESPKTENLPTKQKQEKKPVKANNLSVEDIELGILLNQIALNCDQNDYVDTVSYYDGMGPALIRLCKYSEAIIFFDQDLLDNPNDVEILTNKGAALAKLGHFEEAILYYNHALEINPSFVPALNNKGNALSQMWKFDEAIEIYNVAKNLDPQNKILNKNLALSKSKFVPFYENQQPIFEPDVQNIKTEKIENTMVTLSKRDSQESDFFEQIGMVLSSIGNIFGLK